MPRRSPIEAIAGPLKNMNKKTFGRREAQSLPALKSTDSRVQMTLKTGNQVIPPDRTQIVFVLVVETDSPKSTARR
jgi:hypothetical protein